MADDLSDDDRWDAYAERYDPSFERARGPRKAKPANQRSVPAELVAETRGLEGGFETTYQPARFEKIWLEDSLRSFFDQELITDVLANVKGGKEASVYRCAANPATGETLLAAKVYRPRQFRNLRNDAMYKEGRAVLTADGRAAKNTDHRLMRALGKKTAFGQQVAHTSWLMHEYTTLERLRAAGGAVPRPIAANDNTLLMSYYGDERMAAPILQSVQVGKAEAARLFDEVMRNVELMLGLGLIHGDLSGYNILYWDGAIAIIDFPQVTNSANNRSARAILSRDITRVCEYFATQGLRRDANALAADLWDRYVALHPDDQAADDSLAELEGRLTIDD
jgi:RIO kinase 1